jgi:hypothetical protein
MNCFNWHNISSDYLDGTLPESAKREADDHVESCKECTEHFKHYRVIVSSIASQPRFTVPAPIKKSPLSATLARPDSGRLNRFRWEGVPWYLRTVFEGLGIVLLILSGILIAPKLRALYENSFEKTLSDFKESLRPSETVVDTNDPNIPIAPGKLTAAVVAPSTGDELSGEDESEGEADNVKVGKSQLWRFSLKSVSPDELRPLVIRALTALEVPATTPGLQGMKVPGGIEFDLLLPQALVPKIKNALQKISPPLPVRVNEVPGAESFTWYRVKSRRKVPEGRSQVVIWLSQPN